MPQPTIGGIDNRRVTIDTTPVATSAITKGSAVNARAAKMALRPVPGFPGRQGSRGVRGHFVRNKRFSPIVLHKHVTFDLVEKPVGTLDLLTYLLRHGPANVSEILSAISMNSDTFQRAAVHLRALQFIYDDRQVGFPTVRRLGLTRTGEAFARALGPAGELLASTLGALEAEFEQLETVGEPSTRARRVELLSVLVDREFSAGQWDTVQQRASRLLALATELEDRRAQAHAHLSLGQVMQKRDRPDDALRELGEAIQLASAAGGNDLAAEAATLAGAALERKGRWAEATSHYREALEHAERADDPLRRALVRISLARISGREGRLEESLRALRQAVDELERIDAIDELPRAYVSLGTTAYNLDRVDAVEWFEKAITAARRVSDPRMEAWGMANAAAHYTDTRDYRKADMYLKGAVGILTGLGELTGLTVAELNTANLLAEQDRWVEAERHFEETLRLARETGNRYQEASASFHEGKMMRRRRRSTEARALLTEAKRIFRELGSAERAERCDEELRGLID